MLGGMPTFRSTEADVGKRLRRRLTAGLALPAAALVAVPPGWAPHRLQFGDTLWGLARSHHTTVTTIESVNRLDSALIRAGDLLLLPGAGTSAAGPGGGESAAARSSAAAPTVSTAGYRV